MRRIYRTLRRVRLFRNRKLRGGSYLLLLLAVALPRAISQESDRVSMDQDRAQSVNNLKQIAVALHNFHDTNKALPPPAVCDADGKPLLSWRVLILPFIEQADLYKEFKLDESWDSEHNLSLLPRMPKLYAAGRGKTKAPHTTFYQVVVGPGTAFELRLGTRPFGARGPKLTEFQDGTSNTLLVVEAGEAVPWTKPADVKFDPKGPSPRLGGAFAPGFHAALGDGGVRFFTKPPADRTLRALITRNGGEKIPDDTDSPSPPRREQPLEDNRGGATDPADSKRSLDRVVVPNNVSGAAGAILDWLTSRAIDCERVGDNVVLRQGFKIGILPIVHEGELDRLRIYCAFIPKDEYQGSKEMIALADKLNKSQNLMQVVIDVNGNLFLASNLTFYDEFTAREFDAFVALFRELVRREIGRPESRELLRP